MKGDGLFGLITKPGQLTSIQVSCGRHNVFKVDGIGFKSCAAPAATQALASGEDTIELATPGRKWYICGVANHCQNGQKLVIDVQSQTLAPSPSPSPSPSSSYGSGKITLVPIHQPSQSPAPSPLPWSDRSPWVPRKLFRLFY
ncbi:hypothetical protein L6164_017398 [Bauhinia variegata]|uniref:Uncharacterized protein n=1 Tax=Bauhinia variegata TaxID=167791 RepID=A0ACB9N9Q5_BAUVA|nr:hypothetical protein L6164_017398 [Bauhinia variegata]